MIRKTRNIVLAAGLFLLAGCAVTNFEQELAKGEQGVILWTAEVTSEHLDPEIDKSIGTGIPPRDRYRMWPFLRPLGPGDRLVDEDGDGIRTVSISLDEKLLRRTDNGRLHWDARAVAPGTYSLTAIREQARYVLIGFDRLTDTSLLIPAPLSWDDPNYVVPDSVPSFRVNPGEAVYIGTFVGNVITKSHTSITVERTEKSYRIDDGDKRDVVAAARISPDRPVRTVNLFDGKAAAWNLYTRPVTREDD